NDLPPRLTYKSNNDQDSISNSEDFTPSGVPYTVEIGGDNTDDVPVITLAAGALTLFRCPEVPLREVLGDEDGLEIVKSPAHSKIFYLRASKSGISTNLIVEMKSGPVSILLKAVNDPRPGAFNGEVRIK